MTFARLRTFTVHVNGEGRQVQAYPMGRLLDALRDSGLTGAKEGCGEGECGACAVLLDGELVNSCLVPMVQADGRAVTTIEGLSDGSVAHPIASAFVGAGGAQCGICTPGMVMATVALLREHPDPSEAVIRRSLAGNICRCTGYTKIVDAVRLAAASSNEGTP